MKRLAMSAAAVISLLQFGSARADFTLGFSDCPTTVTGAPGEVKTIHIFATLTSANLPAIPPQIQGVGCPTEVNVGAQGWSFGIRIDGAEQVSIALDTVVVSTIYDNDAKCQTPPLDDLLTLANAGFTATIADPGGSRAGSAVVLSLRSQTRYLRPTGTDKIANLAVTFKIPDVGIAEKVVNLKYSVGAVDSGLPPAVITFGGHSYSPENGQVAVEECSFKLLATASPLRFRRGDVDANGQIEITDAIGILGFLFLGDKKAVQCLEAADTDNSGSVDVTDAVTSLSFQFQGTRPPSAPGPRNCGEDVHDPSGGGDTFLGCNADCK